MKAFIFQLALVFFYTNVINAQNKSGYAFIFGSGAIYAKFDGTLNKPITDSLFTPHTYSHNFDNGSSMICDSLNGMIKVVSNGMILYDSLGNFMDGGQDLQPYKISHHNSVIYDVYTQGSLILPKGSTGLFYMFTNTITDSSYNYWITQNTKAPFDLLQYHIIDMNQNGGLGKVVQKNIPIIQHVDLDKVGMMACRHANGYDWWLIKQSTYDSMVFYKVLVTADSVVVKDTQVINSIKFGVKDLFGQSCFSADGKQFAYVMGRSSQLFLADFNRCTAEFTNYRTVKIPMDSTTDPAKNAAGVMDSTIGGVCFSSNNKFVYVTREYNIYQYEIDNLDSATAWYKVKHGEDTSYIQFAMYGQLHRGVDGRIYIGKHGNNTSYNSVIDNPNNKGAGCNFCRFCLRFEVPNTHTLAPVNMPDFLLGLDSTSCWPVSSNYYEADSEQWELYPNPTLSKIYFKHTERKRKDLYNSVGQFIFSTIKDEIDISRYPKGMYYIRCEGKSKKVVIE